MLTHAGKFPLCRAGEEEESDEIDIVLKCNDRLQCAYYKTFHKQNFFSSSLARKSKHEP